jgi:hypothetical protein
VNEQHLVTISFPEGYFKILYEDYLKQRPLPVIKKLMRIAYDNFSLNSHDIRKIWHYVLSEQDTKRQKWHEESKTYKEEYVALQFLFDLTEKESKEIKAKNKKLLSNVIKAKRDFERWCKIVALLEELNAKMGIAL